MLGKTSASGRVTSEIGNRNSALVRLGAVILATIGCPPVAHSAELVGIRFGERSATETRIVFDSNELPEYRLEAETAGQGRLIVTLTDTHLAKSAGRAGRGAGHVHSFTATENPADATTVTLDLESGAKIKEILIIPPGAASPRYRLVIDLVSAKPADLVASLPAKKYESMAEVIASVAPSPATGAPPAEAQRPTPAATLRLPVIVIDAGHGGTDPGAAGPAGARESNSTLASALALAEMLRGTGRYDVVLTRSKDVRLAHEERSRIAREAKADLFISLHADAHPDAKVRGGSVYTLSDEGTERSAREALAQGNYHVFDLDIGEADPEVGGILYNLAQRRTGNESDQFAEILVSKLSGVTPLLNNTHRRGNFRVLLSPDVPAVLLELAFISNKQDEANLGSPMWRKRSMGAVAAAIDAYFQRRAAERHASNTSAAVPR